MGYWGYIVAIRRPQDQERSVALDAFGEHQQAVADDHHGWLVRQVFGAEPDLARAVAAVATHTQAPVVGAYILDSDCAVVEAAAPGGARWSAVLNPNRAAEYGAPAVAPETAVTAAATWARAAQLPYDGDLIRQVLASEETFAEDQFLALLSAMPATVVAR
ncbi:MULTISPECIES: hypothetical protein [unclassified Actinoplanes]|uniref:hypothetical protein n=1 Tax=unclassified Actinoplanes TaxID=2626549 RepID=UPI0012BAA337|nr:MULTISPECIES: hypothetical protein [unclassified Actinoplanes]